MCTYCMHTPAHTYIYIYNHMHMLCTLYECYIIYYVYVCIYMYMLYITRLFGEGELDKFIHCQKVKLALWLNKNSNISTKWCRFNLASYKQIPSNRQIKIYSCHSNIAVIQYGICACIYINASKYICSKTH